eukprot:jgi/Botrbrau1/18488/Bobra.0072s0068.1
MTDSATEVSVEVRPSKLKRIRKALFHPHTRAEKLFCAAFWLLVAGVMLVFTIFALPRFFKNVVKPFLDICKERLSKPTIAAICFAALSILPLILAQAHIFIWLAAATLGSGWALLVALAANAIGMALPFLLCKWLVEDKVHRWAVKRDWVHALYLAAEEVGAFKVMILMRLGPFPHGLLNYIAATSRDITFLPYILGSFIGSIPDIVIQVFLGNSVDTLSDIFSGGKPTPGRIVSIVLPIVFGIIIGVVAWIFTRRALSRIRARAVAHHPEHAQALEAEARECGREEEGFGSGMKHESSSEIPARRNSGSGYKESRRSSSFDGVQAFVTKLSGSKPLTSGESSTGLLELAEGGSLPKADQPSL